MGATEGGVVSSRPQPTTSEVLSKAANRALGGGASGAAAMGIQVTTLMWMRTTMNYQYRYGTSTTEALRLVVFKRVNHEHYELRYILQKEIQISKTLFTSCQPRG